MATRNYVPRASGEGSIGTEKKHWGGAFFDKLSVKTLEVIGGGTENDAQPATVGWVKEKSKELVKSAFAILGVRYNLGENGYLCMGALFGNLKIQWGLVMTNREDVKNKSVLVTPPISLTAEYFSCGNVNVVGGTESAWGGTKPSVATMLANGKLHITSNYFEPSWAYGIRWLLIGV